MSMRITTMNQFIRLYNLMHQSYLSAYNRIRLENTDKKYQPNSTNWTISTHEHQLIDFAALSVSLRRTDKS